MPRGKTNRLYRTFVKGLITEAGPLTYPENASTAESNTFLSRKGNRARRFGIDYEPSSSASTIGGISPTSVVQEFHWRAVNNISTLNFLVMQIGGTLHFYNTDVVPQSSAKKSFTVDLTAYKSPIAVTADVTNNMCQMASGKGFLFIAHEFVNPLVIEYTLATDSISVVPVVIQMRDYDGVNDGLKTEEEPTTLTKEHQYNLRNQGWIAAGSKPVGPDGGTAVPSPPAGSGSQGFHDPYTGAAIP